MQRIRTAERQTDIGTGSIMLHCSCDIGHSPHFLLTEHSVWSAFHQSDTNSATNICSRQGPHSSNTIKRLLRPQPPLGNPGNRGTPLSVSPAFRFEDVNRCRAETAKLSSRACLRQARQNPDSPSPGGIPCAVLH